MARLRNLSAMAQLLLQSHLRSKAQEDSDARQLANSKVLADYSSGLRTQERGDQFDLDAMKAALQDPTGGIAQRMGMNSLVPSQAQRQAPLMTEIGQADSMEKLPSKEAFLARLAATPGGINSLPEFTQGLNLIDSQTSKIGQNQEAAIDRSGATSYSNAYNTAQGTEQSTKENFPAALGRKTEEGLLDKDMKLQTERAMNPILADRAGAEERQRQQAQWLDPSIVAAKLDFEKQKGITEAANAGNRQLAQEIATRNSQVKNLLPLYMNYKTLATKVADSWAGAGSPASGSVVNTLSKVPFIGEFIASAMESGHGAAAGGFGFGDADTEKNIAELNRITDTLAQGMANSIIGNRGQTTENDRRTAKQVLANSFTDRKTLDDLFVLTDKMFAILPNVTAQMVQQNPTVDVQTVLNEVVNQAKADSGGASGGTTPLTPPQTPLSPGLDAILNR